MFVPTQQISVTGVLFTLGASCVVAEFAGYWLHRLLHSDKIPSLSQSHLIHHFLIYGPDQAMRHDEYHDATSGRFSVGNVGLEWLAPCALILLGCWGILFVAGVQPAYQILSLITLVAWPVFMFSYLHDQMHVKNFWMERNLVFKAWFRGARKRHDIHHRVLNDCGLMDKNFGIGFFLFDRLFGTLSAEQSPFNHRGYAAARVRFKFVETSQGR